MKKLLLLDIDYTIFYNDVPRPYLKEFIERMSSKYNIGLYTAGSKDRVLDVLRYLHHKAELPRELTRSIQRLSLSYETCPTIEHWNSKSSTITIKCLNKAASILRVDKNNIILLDDNPKHGHPDADQIVQAQGFAGNLNDTYLLTLEI